MQGQGCCVFLGQQRSSKNQSNQPLLSLLPSPSPHIAPFIFHLTVVWITAQFIHAPVCIY